MTTITALPTPPSRDDPANFSARADAFFSALPDFVTESNALASELNASAAAADSDAATATTKAAEAAASAAAASASAGVASTKASEAADQVSLATAQANTATAQAGIATTKATEAAASAAAAAADAAAVDAALDSVSGGPVYNVNGKTGNVTLVASDFGLSGGFADTASAQTLSNKTMSSVVLDGSVTEDVYALTGTALNPANGTVQTITLSANTTFTDSLTSGQSMILGIDDGTAYTVTWPTITWTTNPASAPTLPTTGFLWVALWKVGTTLYGKY